jgi:BMFP domain-containing protein YqiC
MRRLGAELDGLRARVAELEAREAHESHEAGAQPWATGE